MIASSRSQAPITNPYVFVVGCPRSGTTLLQRMLDAHPDMTIANDTHFVTRAAKTVLRLDPDPDLTPELVEAVLGYRRFYRMGLEDQDVRQAAENCQKYSKFVSRLYDLRARAHGKTISGEKTPDFCKQIKKLHVLFPQAKFIHIVRDGRDTALSTLDWANESKGPGKLALWKTDPVGTCALWWQTQVSKGSLAGAELSPDRYFEVRYEDLVSDPEGRLKQLADFLEIEYSQDMSRFFVGKTRQKKGLSAKSAWIPPTKGLRDWRSQMSQEDVLLFQELAGEWLEKFGYELLETDSNQPSERADRCRAWWEGRG